MSSFDYSVSKRRGSVETLSVLLRLIQCPSEGALSKIHCRRLISVLTVVENKKKTIFKITQCFIFWAWKKKVTRENFTKILDFGREKKKVPVKKGEKPLKSTRENHFLPVKIFGNLHPWKWNLCAWKKSKILPVKSPKVHVKIVTLFFLMVFLPKIFLLRIQFSAFLLRYWQKTWNLGWHTWNSITKFETFRVTRWAAEPLLCTSRSASSSAPAPWYSRALKGFQLFVFQLLWNHPSFKVYWPKLS